MINKDNKKLQKYKTPNKQLKFLNIKEKRLWVKILFAMMWVNGIFVTVNPPPPPKKNKKEKKKTFGRAK